MGRGIIEGSFLFSLRKRKHGNCISIKLRVRERDRVRGGEEWKQHKGMRKITQKLIILHYDYVVYSLTMRFSNWCQRSQSTQEGRREKWKIKSLFWYESKACGWEKHFNEFSFFFLSLFLSVSCLLKVYSKHVNSYKINLFTLQKLSAWFQSRVSFSWSDYSWAKKLKARKKKKKKSRIRAASICSSVEVRFFFIPRLLIRKNFDCLAVMFKGDVTCIKFLLRIAERGQNDFSIKTWFRFKVNLHPSCHHRYSM